MTTAPFYNFLPGCYIFKLTFFWACYIIKMYLDDTALGGRPQ